MDSTQQLVALLQRVTQLHLAIIAEELDRIGITRPQILVLSEIEDGPKTVGNIARALSLSYSTVSGIVDRLERQNLVVRMRDPADRRVVWVALREKAESFRQRVPFLHDSYYGQIFADLSESDMESVCGALRLLCASLEKKQLALRLEKGEKS